jgi:hypothetical protein
MVRLLRFRVTTRDIAQVQLGDFALYLLICIVQTCEWQGNEFMVAYPRLFHPEGDQIQSLLIIV